MKMNMPGRRTFVRLLLCFTLAALTSAPAFAQNGGELRFCLHSEPKTFDPPLVDDDSSLSIRYLTGGVLTRVNRHTQELEPELAESWKVSNDGKQITFKLRHGILFSDGTPFSAEDVAFTMQRLMDPALHSSTGDAFRSGNGTVSTKIIAPDQVSIIFPTPLAGLDRLFDQVAIMSAHSPRKEAAVLGPFMVAEYKAGSTVLLRRNPNYWKKDSQGRRLPYLDSIRLDIQSNRDVEMLRFKRGELDLINVIDSDFFDRLSASFAGPRARCRSHARFRFHVVQPGGQRSHSRIQARLVPLRRFPPRHFSGHQPRRPEPHRLQRSCSARGWSGIGRQQILVQQQSQSRTLPARRRPPAPSGRRFSPAKWSATRQGREMPSSFPSLPTQAASRENAWP